MMHRIRLAMQNGSFEKLSGNVEVDETFIGGKAKNMHKHKREAIIQGRGSVGKTAVMGLLERKGHQVINHGVEYVRGHIHTNGIENFWSLLKRTIRGTYVSVEPFHLGRYLDEQI